MLRLEGETTSAGAQWQQGRQPRCLWRQKSFRQDMSRRKEAGSQGQQVSQWSRVEGQPAEQNLVAGAGCEGCERGGDVKKS